MKQAIVLAHVRGIEIGAHLSWLITMLLITYTFTAYFISDHPGWPPYLQWSAVIVTTLLFCLSLVAHELGHSLVAQHYDISVKSITLFLFGGVSQLDQEPQSPKAELLIAGAGPL